MTEAIVLEFMHLWVKGAMGQTINKKLSPLSSQGVILCIVIRAKGRGIVFFCREKWLIFKNFNKVNTEM